MYDIFKIISPHKMGLSESIVPKGLIVVAARLTDTRWRVRYDDMDFPINQYDIDMEDVERLTRPSFSID